MRTKYYPILKTKRGELFALSELRDSSKEITIPLFEMTLPNKDWSENDREFVKDVDTHVSQTIESITEKWSRIFFIDFDKFEVLNRCQDMKFLETIFKNSKGMLALDLFNNNPIKHYQQFITEEVLLRIHVNKIDDEEALPEIVKQFCEEYELEREQIYLLLDFGDIANLDEKRVRREARAILPLIYDSDCKGVIISGCSFPSDLSIAKKNNISRFPRSEYKIWNVLEAKNNGLSYSDYTVTGVDIIEMDPKLMRLGAKIKYTSDELWYLFKGEGIQIGGYDQFRDLSQQIIRDPVFHGKEFSWGDEKIYKVGTDLNEGTGNQETWVRVAVNQHLEFVVMQLSS